MVFIRSLSFRRYFFQIALATVVLLSIAYVAATTSENLQRRNLASGFSFLSLPANFGISEGLLTFPSTSSNAWAIAVGLSNTVKVAVSACVLATILGTVVGILRMSSNPLLIRLTRGYIDFLRNVPVLLHLFFWYAVVITLPSPRQALTPMPGVVLSNRGLIVPAVQWEGSSVSLLAIMAICILSAAATLVMRRGSRWRFVLCRLVAVVGLTALTQLDFVPPRLQGFNFQGGWALTVEFTAVLFSLTLYASASIAEIVRAGIAAVSRGQWESGRALGLREWPMLRLVILPQSLRFAVPPMINQYLNIIKNSSLGIAIGFPELVTVSNTIINRTGQAIEMIAVVMAVYLGLSLVTSLVMNWFNRSIKIER